MPPRILIADDQPGVTDALESALTAHGYSVKSVPDGVAAINAFIDEPFDVALLDVKMPNVGGFGVLKFIRKYHPATQVVIITSYGDAQHANEANMLGAAAFVAKPYDIADILTTVKKLTLTP
jgi:DNA-binding NtrC family response regulator